MEVVIPCALPHAVILGLVTDDGDMTISPLDHLPPLFFQDLMILLSKIVNSMISMEIMFVLPVL